MENSRAIRAMRIILAAVIVLSPFVLVGAGTERTFGWDNVEGHPFINEFAYNNFVGQWMPSDQYLKQASLDGTARGESWELRDGTSFVDRIDPHIRTKSIKDWLMEGGFSADEPELDMSLVHFYDPVREPHYLTDTINEIPLSAGKCITPLPTPTSGLSSHSVILLALLTANRISWQRSTVKIPMTSITVKPGGPWGRRCISSPI